MTEDLFVKLSIRQQALKRLVIDYGDYMSYLVLSHNLRYQSSRHIRYLCTKLEEIDRGIPKKLIITMPPRHGKSMAISESFPSFFIGRNPNRRVIEISYSDDFAKKFGRKNRTKILEYGAELWDIEIEKARSEVKNWGIVNHDGGMISSGIGGQITGEGADLLIIDDPIKNMQEAYSKTYRDRLWDEYISTFVTRLQPNASQIIILTRWHEDDLVGRILQNEPGWEVIRFPAIAEENDQLGRQLGEALWPEFGFDKEYLEQKRLTVGSKVFNSLYQQRPIVEDGSIFRRQWFRFYREMPTDFDVLLLSADLSFKDTSTSDFVAIGVWGKKDSKIYLLDRINERLGFTDTCNKLKLLQEKWPNYDYICIEDKANGPAVIQTLRGEVGGIRPIQPLGSKEARAHAVTPLFEAGWVYIPDPVKETWVVDYMDQLVAFPNAMHDDEVDQTTQALNTLKSCGGMVII